MKNSPRCLITGLMAGTFVFPVLSLPAHAYWTGPEYTISNRVCTPPDNTVTTTTNPPQAGGSPSAVNNPNGATITAKYTWVRNTPLDAPPAKVYILHYSKALWNMSPPPQGAMGQPSIQEASFSRRAQPKIRLIQAQAGTGSATNGLGHAQVITTDANGYKTGTSEGYKLVQVTTAANDTATTSSVTLLTGATNGPGQSYMPFWQYNAQLLDLKITCNSQDITSPKPAYQTTVGLKNTLSFTGATATGVVVTNPSWTLPTTTPTGTPPVAAPSQYVKDWLNSDSAASVIEVPASEKASISIPKLFWVSGGTKAVSFSATINGLAVTLNGSIQVTRPEHAFSVASTGTAKIGSDANYGDNNIRLHYGDPYTATAGVTFTVNPYPQPNTVLKLAQIVTSSTITALDGANHPHTHSGTSGLDAFPAPGTDSPAQEFPSWSTDLLMDQSFETWLMYYPPSTGVEHDAWIHVPLKKLAWHWSAHAKRR